MKKKNNPVVFLSIFSIMLIIFNLSACKDIIGDIAKDIAVFYPDINIKQDKTNILVSTGSFSFPEIVADGPGEKYKSSKVEFTIENTGQTNLVIYAITATADDFVVDTSATSFTIAGSASTKFSVLFDPIKVGEISSTLKITSNDVDEASYVFTMSGTGVERDITAPAKPAKPDLDADGDSGVSNSDNITNLTTGLTILGTAEKLSIVELYSGETVIATTDASALGAWSVDIDLPEGTHTLTVCATDSADNKSEASEALVLQVDTTIAAPGEPDLNKDSDTGSSNIDNITGIATELVFDGTAEPGATVSLYSGPTFIKSGTAASTGDWSIACDLTDGTHSLTAVAGDAAGNGPSDASKALSIKVLSSIASPSAPDLDTAADTGISSSDNITRQTTGLNFSGTATPNATVTLYRSLTISLGTCVADASGSWSTELTLPAGTHSVTARAYLALTEQFSNHSEPLSVSVDTSCAAPSAPDLSAEDDSGSLSNDDITKKTNALSLTGTTEPGSVVELFREGTAALGTAGVTDGNWSFEATLAAGTHAITAIATDLAGNVSPASTALSLVVDTTADKPSAPNLTDASDSGKFNYDNVTGIATGLVFDGTAEANAEVSLYESSSAVGSGTADASGAWSITMDLAAGTHAISAKATSDRAGNGPSLASSALSVVVRTAIAAPSVPDLDAADDTGTSISDNITKNTGGLTFSGTALAGAKVTLYSALTTELGNCTANGSGNWSLDVTLGAGSHSVSALAYDETTYQSSSHSPALNVTIDTSCPAPSAPDLAAADDSGSLSNDNITKNTNALTLNGTTESGSSIEIFRAGTIALGTANASAGNWNFEATLAEGTHAITAVATDIAGNVSPASEALSLVIDTTAQSPSSPDLNYDSDSGTSHTDNKTGFSIGLVFDGTAETNAEVSLYEGATVLGSGTANSSGAWSITCDLAAGTHGITARITADSAGNGPSTASSALSVQVLTAIATPSVPDLDTADDTGSSSSDNITKNTGGLTFSGTSIASVKITLYDGSLAAPLGNCMASAGGTWSLDLTLGAGTHPVFARAEDEATEQYSSQTAAVSITVDNSCAAPTLPDLAASDDSGSSSTDNITKNTSALTFSGTAEIGSSVELFRGGSTSLGSMTAASGNWSFEFTLAEAAYSISAIATDTAGNVSAASAALTLIVDTSTPAAPSIPDLADASDTGTLNGDNITKNTTGLVFAGTAETGATVELFRAGTVSLGSGTATGGNWSFAAAALLDGANSITAVATDPAGNSSSVSGALSVTVDTAAAAPSQPDLAAADDTGTSSSDNLTKNTVDLTFSGTAETGSTVELFREGSVSLGSAAAAGGNWSIDAILTPSSHTILARITDIAGNVSAFSLSTAVEVDVSAPAMPGIPDLATEDDSGIATDNITKNTSALTFTGTAVESTSRIELFRAGTVSLGTSTVSGGVWSIDASLLEGSYSITAVETDAAGNASSASFALALTVDTTVANPSIPDLDATDDTGSSDTDNLTRNTSALTFNGTAESGAAVTIKDGATVLASGTATGGNWIIDASLAAGLHTISAYATDIAGNISGTTTTLSVTVDTTAPGIPGTPNLADASDSGTSNTDNITKTTTGLSFTGTAEVGIGVSIYRLGTVLLNSGTATGGNWSIAADLAEGAHSITAVATDAAGNSSAASTGLSVTIDATAPSAPALPNLLVASDLGSSNTDNITSKANPLSFDGSATSGLIIKYYDETTNGGSVASSGTYAFSLSLSEASHDITVTATDVAGNESANSPILTVLIDRTAPSVPSVPDLAATSDTGFLDNDNITKLLTLTFNGTADANVNITHIITGTGLGSTTPAATADGSGNWSFPFTFMASNSPVTVSAKAVDLAGNESVASSGLVVTIDTAAPSAPTGIDLATADDTGSNTADNTTKQTTDLTISGSGTNGTRIELFRAGTISLGTMDITVGTAWTFETSLAEAVHSITAKATDAAGNTSSASTALSITVDTTVAAPSIPDLLTADDTGSSSSDNLTKLTSGITFTGTAEAGASVSIKQGSTDLNAGTATGGNYSIDTSLTEGVYGIFAVATDIAGNVSSASSSLSVTVDTTPPTTTPSLPDLASADDSGYSSTDNITNLATALTFSGSAATGDTIVLYRAGSTILGTMTAAGSAWSFDLSIAEGVHSITAASVDAAGNENTSGALTLTIDTTIPLATNLLTPFQGDNTGKNLKPTFKWKTIADAYSYDLQVDDSSGFASAEISQTVVGAVTYTPGSDLAVSGTAPVGRRYYVRLRSTDAAGNSSTWSDSTLLRYVNIGRFDADLNGDGFSDVIIGTRSLNAYVYLGKTTASLTTPIAYTNANFTITQAETIVNLDSVGDLNADGFQDLVVTTNLQSYLYYGSAAFNVSSDLTLSGKGLSSYSDGDCVSAAGDINGDGYGDLIIGDSSANGDAGAAYIYYGGSAMTSGIGTTLSPIIATHQFGAYVSGGGDMNGDGYSDVVVGMQYTYGYGSLYLGGASMETTADLYFPSTTAVASGGAGVLLTGDMNGDGYADAFIVSQDTTANVCGYYGASTVENNKDITFSYTAQSNFFMQLSSADLNSDGFEDLIFGHSQTASSNGKAYAYYGGATIDTLADYTLSGSTGSAFGQAVAGGGDVDGDGFDDIIVGEWMFNSLIGQAYLYRGGSSADTTKDVTFTGNGSATWKFGGTVR